MAVANLKVPKAPKNPVAGLEEDPMAHLLKEFECVCVCVCVFVCVAYVDLSCNVVFCHGTQANEEREH